MDAPLVSSVTDGAVGPLEWSGLSFGVGGTEILRDLTGCFRPGQLTCILGPSGAGKSTLLNLLSGRQSTGGQSRLQGSIQFDGVEVDPAVFRQRCAFVMQEETLLPTETPREALCFSAGLRKRLDPAAAAEAADEILKELGLAQCADTRIGNALVKGISGGEKKRTAVGIELITRPRVFMLDEPTSGLDSYAAYELIKTLKGIAQRGNLVCLTIHQPSSEVFECFDHILCLRRGQTFFQGPPGEIVPAFAKVGLRCPPTYNPADFLLFQAQTIQDDVAEKLTASADEGVPRTVSHSNLEPPALKPRARGWELSMLLKREFRCLGRDKALLGSKLGMNFGQAVIFSIIYWRVTDDIGNTFSALAGLGIAVLMGSSQPLLLTFPNERPVFLREYVSDMYSVVSYFAAKTVAEMATSLLVVFVMFAIAWPCMQLHGNFLQFVLVAWLLALSSGSVALYLGSATSSGQKALTLAPAIFVPQILFSGLFLPSSQVPVVLRWVQYICTLKYGINLFAIVELGSYARGTPEDIAGRAILEHMDVQIDSWPLYIAILFAVTIGFRILAMVSLRRKARFVF